MILVLLKLLALLLAFFAMMWGGLASAFSGEQWIAFVGILTAAFLLLWALEAFPTSWYFGLAG